MRLKSLMLMLPALAFSAAALADDAKKPRAEPQAKSATQAKAPATPRYDFDRADTNKDGVLSREEFNAMMKGQRSAAAGTTTPRKEQRPASSK